MNMLQTYTATIQFPLSLIIFFCTFYLNLKLQLIYSRGSQNPLSLIEFVGYKNPIQIVWQIMSSHYKLCKQKTNLNILKQDFNEWQSRITKDDLFKESNKIAFFRCHVKSTT